MCLLVVDMLDVFSLVSNMRFNPYKVDVSKTFVFLTRRTPGKLVPGSLQYVFRQLLVFNYTQLGQKYGPTSRYSTYFVDVHQDVLPFCASGQHHLNNFLPRYQCPCLVGHRVSNDIMMVDNVAEA